MYTNLQINNSQLKVSINIKNIKALHVYLYGSLAKTGKGHGTDTAVLMGLLGEEQPKTIVGCRSQIIEEYKQLLVEGNEFGFHLGLAFYGSFEFVYFLRNALNSRLRLRFHLGFGFLNIFGDARADIGKIAFKVFDCGV